MNYLLDAGTLAAGLRGRLPVVLRLSQLRPTQTAISTFTRVQVEIALRSQPRTQARFGKLMREFVDAVRVIDFGDAEAEQAINVGSSLVALGERIGAVELALAATALAHRRTLVVEDVGPYRSVAGLTIENWLDETSGIT